MSAQLKARKRRNHKSVEWDQLEDLATELLRAQQAQTPPAPSLTQSAAPEEEEDNDDNDDDDEGDEDDNDLLLRRILSSKAEAGHKSAPPPLDPKANRELEEFLKSETALDLLAKLAAKKASKPSP